MRRKRIKLDDLKVSDPNVENLLETWETWETWDTLEDLKKFYGSEFSWHPQKVSSNELEKIVKHFDEEKQEHEITRLFISDKIDKLSDEIVTKDDIIESQEKIIIEIRKDLNSIKQSVEEQIKELQNNLLRFLPFKRMFKTSFYCILIMLASIFIKIFFGVTIIESFWAWLGAIVSGGFLIMALFMSKEWKAKTHSHL